MSNELMNYGNDKIIKGCYKTISEVGVQAIHLIGEQLLKIKNRIIELTGDKRAPGFIDFAEKEFGFKKMTISRYIKAFESKETNIKRIWGHENSVSLAIPNNGDFVPFIYNIWNQQSGDGKDFFGHFPLIFMKNILYYHTSEYELIYDPFSGSGTTIDACREMKREYYCTDLNPARKEIIKHDIKNGLPDNAKDADLIFIDPPYWRQARNKYSNDKDDLGNIELDDFYRRMEILLYDIIENKINKIAILISPTQWPNENHEIENHAYYFANKLFDNYKIEMNYIIPYSTQQYNGNQVNIAKDKKIPLNVIRYLDIWVKK